MITITKYRKIDKGIMIASFNISIEKWGGFTIRDMTLFQKDGKRWISFPCRQFEVEGEKKYMQYCTFEEDKTLKAFQQKVISALDEYLKNSM